MHRSPHLIRFLVRSRSRPIRFITTRDDQGTTTSITETSTPTSSAGNTTTSTETLTSTETSTETSTSSSPLSKTSTSTSSATAVSSPTPTFDPPIHERIENHFATDACLNDKFQSERITTSIHTLLSREYHASNNITYDQQGLVNIQILYQDTKSMYPVVPAEQLQYLNYIIQRCQELKVHVRYVMSQQQQPQRAQQLQHQPQQLEQQPQQQQRAQPQQQPPPQPHHHQHHHHHHYHHHDHHHHHYQPQYDEKYQDEKQQDSKSNPSNPTLNLTLTGLLALLTYHTIPSSDANVIAMTSPHHMRAFIPPIPPKFPQHMIPSDVAAHIYMTWLITYTLPFYSYLAGSRGLSALQWGLSIAFALVVAFLHWIRMHHP